MRFSPLFTLLVTLTPLTQAQDSTLPAAETLDRVLETAQKSASWPLARTQSDRLALLREKALVHKSETTPVSDRYLITALAGPIDPVHFFGLARNVCSGRDRRTELFREWQREGGTNALTPSGDAKSADCTPDDIPSNALGALFGEETQPHEADPNYDLIASLRQFFTKLEPIPDAIVKTHPHESAVLGLTPESSREEIKARHEWFTAMPLYIIPIVAPQRAAALPDAATALNAAGLLLRQYDGQPIILDRVGSPELPPKGVVRAVPADSPAPKKPSKAVQVD